MRKIAQFQSDNGRHVARVYRDSEWNEYRVEFFGDGKKLENATYHTDDRDDAIATASKFCKEENE